LSRYVLTLLAAVLLPFPGAGRLAAQELAIHLEPDRTESGPGGEFLLVCRLENPHYVPVVAYQLYIGYDASKVEPLGVTWPDDAVLGEGKYSAGVFDGHSGAVFERWRDRVGTDVVSVSGFTTDPTPFSGEGVLCLVRFRVSEAAGSSVLNFVLDPGPYWSFSGAFGAEGGSIPVRWEIGSLRLSAVAPVRNLQCLRNGEAVDLSWDPPAAAVDGIEVERNGEVLTTLPADGVSFTDHSAPLGVNAYHVVTVSGGEKGPAETCEVEVVLDGPQDVGCVFDGTKVSLRWTLPYEFSYLDLYRNDVFLVRVDGEATEYVDSDPPVGESAAVYSIVGVLGGHRSEPGSCTVDLSGGEGIFLRGDANVDGRRVMSDAIVLLRYLFSGGSLSCLDAADFDDNGRLQITDAVALLGWLFKGGTPPPPPNDAPGPDPTPDSLSCIDGL